MPELAEVEAVRLSIVEQMKKQKIISVDLDVEDRWLFAFAKHKDVQKALVGATILGAGRKGKYFWLELDRKPWPIFHLGMSGNFSFLNPKLNPKKTGHQKTWGGAKLWSEKDQDHRMRLWFSRLLIKTKGGLEMAMLDPRRFGRMWLAEDPWQHPRIKKLGYDPLLDFPPPKVLAERLKKRRKAIKAVLLDQSLFAGIGNWLADEILYTARLSPHHLASDLTAAQVKTLHKSILMVVKTAVRVRADYERFPKDWIFHDRWGKVKNSKTKRGAIIHEEVGSRTTAWVPGWQK
jgi:formamidopyrimidine-DNA glycosylase